MLSEKQVKAVGRQCLVVSLGPAHDLPDAHRPVFRNFLVALRAILINRLPAVQEKAVGEVGVFREGVFVPATDLAQRAEPDARDRAAMLRHQVKIHSRLLVHLIAAGPFEVEQPRQQICADIQGHDAPHYATHLGIEKWRHELFDQTAAGNVIGVED